jgi:hypothetical protein
VADDENIVGLELATTSFTLEREVGLTIEGDDGARQWLSWLRPATWPHGCRRKWRTTQECELCLI